MAHLLRRTRASAAKAPMPSVTGPPKQQWPVAAARSPALSCAVRATLALLHALVVRVRERSLDRRRLRKVHVDALRRDRARKPLRVDLVDLAGFHDAADRLVDQRLELRIIPAQH